MKKIKLGILGVGNIGRLHLGNVLDGKCPSVEVTAVCDIEEKNLHSQKRSIRQFSALQMQ